MPFGLNDGYFLTLQCDRLLFFAVLFDIKRLGISLKACRNILFTKYVKMKVGCPLRV